MKKILVIILLLFTKLPLHAQQAFSLATDLSLLRNFSKDQQFTTVGQTIQANFHLTPKESVYAWVSYYVNGKYDNELLATAKDPFSGPDVQYYKSSSKLGFSQFSLGWKHFLKGNYANENWNLYGTAGFGLLTGRVENTHDPVIDTSVFFIPNKSIAGVGKFRRLTFDVAIGSEINLATGLYLYAELKSWLPISNYPSRYLLNNSVPQVLMLNGGVRILFD